MTHSSAPSDNGDSAGPAPGPRPDSARPKWPMLAAAVGLAIAIAAGYLWGRAAASPADDSVEAGFARDMQVHHAQAVEMSLIVREKSRDPALRAMAYDVITGQQQQIGQMYAWLDSWGLPQTSSRAAMAWMKHSGMAGMETDPRPMKALPDGRMPGMASPADVKRLSSMTGRAAEVQWLQLMIPHHQAGVRMAAAALRESTDSQVVKLARAIRTAQLAEIEQMRKMLTDRNAAPDIARSP